MAEQRGGLLLINLVYNHSRFVFIQITLLPLQLSWQQVLIPLSDKI